MPGGRRYCHLPRPIHGSTPKFAGTAHPPSGLPAPPLGDLRLRPWVPRSGAPRVEPRRIDCKSGLGLPAGRHWRSPATPAMPPWSPGTSSSSPAPGSLGSIARFLGAPCTALVLAGVAGLKVAGVGAAQARRCMYRMELELAGACLLGSL